MTQDTYFCEEEFAHQFMSILYQRWPEVLQHLDPQSPRLAETLQLDAPPSLKRAAGVWYIQIAVAQQDKLRQPRDNEFVAQAIRAWAYKVAQLQLPRVTITFEEIVSLL